ncbi:umbelliferone 6-dimethylallyltransferase, chloroplastic [Daucus carota subsp. sativus]|uniref:umbelliferone 6-dimethylallyltransferase, chloroplastic n=1 Tax=Daucus carota subsp. sativus TaxID=79200 RepID=UPI0007F0343A|nr:PREDICTED: probable homogentisate phytyltransferase 1, chloroplastic [Daucus carota subsp. sativus]
MNLNLSRSITKIRPPCPKLRPPHFLSPSSWSICSKIVYENQAHTLREVSSVHKRTRNKNKIGQTFCATLKDESVPEPKEDNNKVTAQSDIWRKWDVFRRFCRLHSVTGTVTGIVSISLLPLTSFGDLSPAFVLGILQSVLPFAFINIYVGTLNQLTDLGIDKINKPHYVLVSGEYSMGQGKAITAAIGIMGLGTAIMFGSPPLLYGAIIHFLVGTAYSVELPYLRWKTNPFLAALSIGLHTFYFQLPVFSHIQKYVLGRPLVHPKSFYFVLIFFSLFATVLGVFKDIPDVAGDEAFGNQTYSVRHGKKKVFVICISVLLINYGFAVVSGAVLSSLLLSKLVTVVGHCTLASLLWRRAKSLDLDDDSAVESLYMFLWKLFTAEYALIQFIR